jgi:hypothetical protein
MTYVELGDPSFVSKNRAVLSHRESTDSVHAHDKLSPIVGFESLIKDTDMALNGMEISPKRGLFA